MTYWVVVHAVAFIAGAIVFHLCGARQSGGLQRVMVSIFVALTVAIAVLLMGNGVAAWGKIPRPLYLQGSPEIMLLTWPGAVVMGLLLLPVPRAIWDEWRAGTLTGASILDGLKLLCVAGAWLIAVGILTCQYLWSLEVKAPSEFFDHLVTLTLTYEPRSRMTGTYDISNYVPGGVWSVSWLAIKIGTCLLAVGGGLLLLVALQRRVKNRLGTSTERGGSA